MLKDPTSKIRRHGSPVPPDQQVLRAKFPNEFAAFLYVRHRCAKQNLTLSPRWAAFETFLADVGTRPTPFHTIVQINPALKEFGPGNAKWMSRKEQVDRRRASDDLSTENAIVVLLTKSVAEVHSNAVSSSSIQCDELVTWNYDGPLSEAEFNIKYNAWKKTVRPRFSVLAMPEIYFYLDRVRDYIVLGALSRSRSAEYGDARSEVAANRHNSQYKRLEKNLVDALESIRKKCPTLASELATTELHELPSKINELYRLLTRRSRPFIDED